MLKTLWFGLFFYLYLFKITPDYIKIKKLEAQDNRALHIESIRNISHKWGKALLRNAGARLNVSGTENIPNGPVLFVSNHQSYFDIPIFFAAIDKQIGFIAKSELSKIPIFSKWIILIQSIFIERDDPRQSLRAIQKGVSLLKDGYSLVVFPEGTRSKGNEMSEFKKGSLRLAVKSKVPIVPVTINGSYRLFESKGRITPGEVDFMIHPPILTDNLSKEEATHLTERVQKEIVNKLNAS